MSFLRVTYIDDKIVVSMTNSRLVAMAEKMYFVTVFHESEKTSRWTTYRGTDSLGDVSTWHRGLLRYTDPQQPDKTGDYDVYCSKLGTDPVVHHSSQDPGYFCLFQVGDDIHEFQTNTGPPAAPQAMWDDSTSHMSFAAASVKIATPAALESLGSHASAGPRYDCLSASNECWEPSNVGTSATCDPSTCNGKAQKCAKEDYQSEYTVFCGAPQAKIMASHVDAATGTLLHSDDHSYSFLMDKPTF